MAIIVNASADLGEEDDRRELAEEDERRELAEKDDRRELADDSHDSHDEDGHDSHDEDSNVLPVPAGNKISWSVDSAA